jgi:hypothetical protein
MTDRPYMLDDEDNENDEPSFPDRTSQLEGDSDDESGD